VNLPDTIRAIQKALGVDVDGNAGPQTWQAIYSRIVGPIKSTGPLAATDRVDDRSEKAIATLQAEVRPYARALITKAQLNGITVKILSGLRSYEEQDESFAQGRSKPGRIVTNARAGYSNHNFGMAFDIGIFEGSKYIEESPKYKAVGVLGQELGLEWGGSWTSIQDEPHFQLRPRWASDISEREMLSELRARKESGKGFYA